MTKLSVNINKIATIRNARGGDSPNVVEAAISCQKFGADGITIHPRLDERHITNKDVWDIKPIISTEYNIEGYPDDTFFKIINDIKPAQVTLVPDPPDALTSSFGWDCEKNKDFLMDVIKRFKDNNIRVSIFINPSIKTLSNLEVIKPDRVELYLSLIHI